MRPAKAPFELAVHRHQAHLAARRGQTDIAGHGQRPGGEGAGRRGFGHAQPGHHADAFTAVLFGHAVEAIPDTLGQAGGGEEEQFHPRKKTLAQLGVLFQGVDQLFPALGDRQVSRGRNFLEVAQGLGKPLDRGLAVVQIKGATVVEHNADVVAAAKGVIPRQPVHQHRRFLTEHRKRLQQHLLVGAEHALGGDHGLGQFGRARGEEKLGNAVGTGGIEGLLGLSAPRRVQQAGEAYLAAPGHLAAHADQRGFGRQYGLDRTLVGRRIADEHQPGLQQVTDMP